MLGAIVLGVSRVLFCCRTIQSISIPDAKEEEGGREGGVTHFFLGV